MNHNGGWQDIVKVWGVPGALLAYLIYWMTNEFSRQISQMTSALHANTETLRQIQVVISNLTR